jgi:hypothetical protein
MNPETVKQILHVLQRFSLDFYGESLEPDLDKLDLFRSRPLHQVNIH